MRSTDLQSQIINYTVLHSGHEAHRRYIGLSGIGDCDQVIYDRYMHGSPANVTKKLKTRLAYELEADLVTRLKAIGLYSPGKEIVLYGGLVKGHTDGFIGGDLLEIKTIEREEWIPSHRKIPNRIYFQVQAYLHYTETRFAHLVYLARDSGAVRVVGLTRNKEIGLRIDEKVQRLVIAVTTYERPECVCGRCQATDRILVET